MSISRSARSLVVTAALLAGLTPACNAYDPALDDEPFSCIEPDYECPDGYNASNPGPGCTCVRSGGSTGDGGGMPVSCEAEANLEPNESAFDAAATPVGNGATTTVFDAVICSAEDVDFFEFRTTAPGQTATASITFDTAAASLGVQITDAQGIALATGNPAGNRYIAQAPLQSSGIYYVKVSTASGTAGYKLAIQIN